jgi:hypothetical protein
MISWEEIAKKRQEWAKRNKTKPIKREYSIPDGLNLTDRILFVSEKEYERGDKTAILNALQFYLLDELANPPHKPIPRWLVLALFRALAQRTLHNMIHGMRSSAPADK